MLDTEDLDKELFIQRMETELDELCKKINSLEDFINSEVFKKLKTVETHLLWEQYKAMKGYRNILRARISMYR